MPPAEPAPDRGPGGGPAATAPEDERITVGDGRAHLWLLQPEELARTGRLRRYREVLAPEERDRVRRLRLASDGLAVTAAWGLARLALSLCAPGIAPEVWRFSRTPHGRPEIADPVTVPPLRFNISHTEGLVACVIADRDCGVDVERRDRPANVPALAPRVLTPTELATLNDLSPAARRDLFLRYWTLKESYIKARGLGLSLPMNRCGFALRPEGIGEIGEIHVLTGTDADGGDQEWFVDQWAPTPGHLVAVTVRRAGPEGVTVHRTPPG